MITDVEEKSAGEKAGLQIGDFILEVNGRKIYSVKDYNNSILEDEMKTGEFITLRIRRKEGDPANNDNRAPDRHRGYVACIVLYF